MVGEESCPVVVVVVVVVAHGIGTPPYYSPFAPGGIREVEVG